MVYFASNTKNGCKGLVVCESHVIRILRNDFNKELKKLSFDLLVVQAPSTWTDIS